MHVVSVIVAIALASTLFIVHVNLHKENACHMTYMWRYISLMPFSVDGNTIRSYGLYRYMEGLVNERSMAISSNDIPVLFVPGSGGSAKQVRSVASIMMNKTEMTSAPFRMHFYALDFSEELSFLSGTVLSRQRDFVIKAMDTIAKMYSRKIILIGHSFGGTVLHALPAIPYFDVSRLGLIITLAAPLSAPPGVMDEAMTTFYESMEKSWRVRRDELRRVVVVSYSGGSKDFQVPDHLAALPGSHVVHRPSWSVRGVDTSADHLCILWCNQLTRHSTRVLYRYGLEEVKTKPRSTRTIVKEFFEEERINFLRNFTVNSTELERSGNVALNTSSDFVKIGIFDYPWVSRVYEGILENRKKVFELEFHSLYAVYDVSMKSGCDVSLLFVYSNSLARSAVLKGDSKMMTVSLLHNLNTTSGHLVMEGKSGCDYYITIKPNVFHAWYLLLVSNAGIILHFSFSVLLALAIIEKLAGTGGLEHCGPNGFYLNAVVLIAIFLCFTYNVWLMECVFAATIFYVISCLYYLSVIVRTVKELMYTTVPIVAHFLCVVLTLLILLLLPFNVYLANSALALLMVWKRESGPFAILVGVAVGSVSTALGVAGPARSKSEQLVGYVLEADLLDISSMFNFILNNIDFSNNFTTPVLFFILSRFVNIVQPPQYLVSFKDLFLVVLLIVPAFLSSQISLSLEASAVAASFLLTILSLL